MSRTGTAATLAEVESARAARDESTDRLRTAVAEAQTDGHPIAAIARAAGVTRETIYQWLREEPSGENPS